MLVLKLSAAAVLVVIVAGCASTGGSNAGRAANASMTRTVQEQPSSSKRVVATERVGHPQVLIPGTDRKAVTDALVSRLVPQGWVVTKTNDYLLELEQPAKGAAGFLGSLLSVNQYVTDPVFRLTFNIFESGEDVRATAASALIQNPHTGTESAVRLDKKKHEVDLWNLLESVRDQLGRVKVAGDSSGVVR